MAKFTYEQSEASAELFGIDYDESGIQGYDHHDEITQRKEPFRWV